MDTDKAVRKEASVSASGQSAWPRVLVVDDSSVNRKLAVLMLAKFGVSADAVENGRAALEAFESAPYGLILMDCHMPEMDGFAACREMRKREGAKRRLPVIAMTADDQEEDRKACREAGMDDHLAKPVRLQDIERILRCWMSPVATEDIRRIEDLLGGDPEALSSLVLEFAASGSALLALIESAVAKSDRVGLAAAAHSLRGAVLPFGARPLAVLCARLEALAAAGPVVTCGAFSSAVAEEFQRVLGALQALAAKAVRPV